LAKPLESFHDVLNKAKDLQIMTQKDAAAEQYMSSTSNVILREIQKLSDAAGLNNITDMVAALKMPNTVYFSEIAYFILQIYPPSANVPGIAVIMS
jgi:hypothetical protein